MTLPFFNTYYFFPVLFKSIPNPSITRPATTINFTTACNLSVAFMTKGKKKTPQNLALHPGCDLMVMFSQSPWFQFLSFHLHQFQAAPKATLSVSKPFFLFLAPPWVTFHLKHLFKKRGTRTEPIMALFLHRKATAPKAIRVTMATDPAGQRRCERAQFATSNRNTGASAPRAWFELETSLLSE